MLNVKPKTSFASFGLLTGAKRKAGIVSAALPKMRTPSGLAAEHMKPPAIKLGVDMHSALGFAKCSYSVAAHRKMKGGEVARATASRDNVSRGINAATGGALGGLAGYVATRRLPVPWRAAAATLTGAAGAHLNLRTADRRWGRKMKPALSQRLEEIDKKAAEVSSGFEQGSGELGSGAALGDRLRSMMRPFDADESSQVAGNQVSYRRFHGHDGDGESGRP